MSHPAPLSAVPSPSRSARGAADGDEGAGSPAATRRRALPVGLAVAGVGTLAAVAEVDRESASWLGTEGRPCTLRAALGEHVCPGCGMTRSVALTVQGEAALAWQLNPAGPAFVGFGLVTGTLAVAALVRGRRFHWENTAGRVMRGGLLLAVAVVGVLRWTGEIG